MTWDQIAREAERERIEREREESELAMEREDDLRDAIEHELDREDEREEPERFDEFTGGWEGVET